MQMNEGLRMRMLAVDMDGTLLGTDGQVSPRNLAALKAAEGAGAAGGECCDQLEWDGGADDRGSAAGAGAAAYGYGDVALRACGRVQGLAGDDVRQGGAGWGGYARGSGGGGFGGAEREYRQVDD